MEPIIKLSRSEALNLMQELQRVERTRGITDLRVHVDGKYAKFKVNQFSWSPPLGELEAPQ